MILAAGHRTALPLCQWLCINSQWNVNWAYREYEDFNREFYFRWS